MSLGRFHALIRTHHITSRKKVAVLRKAADHFSVFAMLRVGGSPGIMYCKGSEDRVRGWVAAVHRLRYKDFRVISPPEPVGTLSALAEDKPGLVEVADVNDFAAAMDQRALSSWWKAAMEWS
ncbi:hypothetical protein B0T26DRAFT_636675 [Lasiosphaeria miniovina]|uniref:Uncharacterized protein n=1 Tax=Lasiosphaeria miniovina TaxID=1954250 RepID=A0AA40E4S8_9PEZI|nr:uncharacterized protein B0T26DRAFT_636675 [Lasiosphaeria miniovina]KAK0728179.1 hypothetical protein B0T26DRAFT_636675 [Lasiosphaeria miniovina]